MKKHFKIATLLFMVFALSFTLLTTFNATTTTVEAASGQWKQDSNGWLELRSSISNTWCYFGADGQQISDQWIGNYFIGTQGFMISDVFIGSYYVGPTGLYAGKFCDHTWTKCTSAPIYENYYSYYPYSDDDAYNYLDSDFGYLCHKCNTLRNNFRRYSN